MLSSGWSIFSNRTGSAKDSHDQLGIYAASLPKLALKSEGSRLFGEYHRRSSRKKSSRSPYEASKPELLWISWAMPASALNLSSKSVKSVLLNSWIRSPHALRNVSRRSGSWQPRSKVNNTSFPNHSGRLEAYVWCGDSLLRHFRQKISSLQLHRKSSK